jgi:hypothetical protein
MTNTIHSFEVNDDGSFLENKATKPEDKAAELKTKYGELAIDVVNDVLNAIKHEDNVMYYEIKFWNEVLNVLKSEK